MTAAPRSSMAIEWWFIPATWCCPAASGMRKPDPLMGIGPILDSGQRQACRKASLKATMSSRVFSPLRLRTPSYTSVTQVKVW